MKLDHKTTMNPCLLGEETEAGTRERTYFGRSCFRLPIEHKTYLSAPYVVSKGLMQWNMNRNTRRVSQIVDNNAHHFRPLELPLFHYITCMNITPDDPFHKLGSSKSATQRFWTALITPISWSCGFKIMKGLVGLSLSSPLAGTSHTPITQAPI